MFLFFDCILQLHESTIGHLYYFLVKSGHLCFEDLAGFLSGGYVSLDKGTKEEITKKFQLHEKDTGSADVQIAILTERIAEVMEHLNQYPKDHSSRLALLKLVGQRRKLLDYLNSTDTKRYQMLISRLNLRK
jgi:small subunit ribosomal protein S15